MTTSASENAALIKKLLDASATLEALRPQASEALTSDKEEDKPLCVAWSIALTQFRKACEDWAKAQPEYQGGQ